MFNANYEMFKSMILGKQVAVLGLGISNLPALEFLYDQGATVSGCDRNTEDKFDLKTFETIKKYCRKLYLGEDYLNHLDEFDVILKSPGIKVKTEQIQKAIAAGKVVTSEIEIFMTLCPCKIIGVTGSDGKTTTTTLIYEMLKREGYRAHVGGNIGMPLLKQLDSIYDEDMVVLELSSFQLQTLHTSPEVAVITNITPNHLDYHGDMEEYSQAKANIFRYHDENCRLVLNADNAVTNAMQKEYAYTCDLFSRKTKTNGAYLYDNKIYYKDEPILDVDSIKIKGWHNVENYMAAICAVKEFVSDESIQYIAKHFGGVEHRMEFVRMLNSIQFFNDSIGSSPTRTIAGLNAQPDSHIVLIAGGYDKKLSFDKLAEKIIDRVSVLVLCGATSDQIEAAVHKASGGKSSVPIVRADTMERAVKSAYAMARGIDSNHLPISVILSPACASFDMFKNFEERGNAFKKIVNLL